jgi:hypothetical protein
MTILTEYVAALNKNAARYKEAENYYKGEVAESFASARLAHVLRSTGHKGTHNYCRVIVDAVLNRLEIANVVCDTQRAQAKVTEVWDENELALEAYEIHRNALTYGDAYALVWPDEEGKIQVSYNSPRTTALVYDPENPRKKLYAVKMWVEKGSALDNTKARTRLNVYTKDAIHKFVTDTDEIVSEGTQWRGIGKEDNPFDEIPVFHFRTHRPYGKPEHFEAYGPQNDMNKLIATHMFTVDYQGAPQRYALAMQGEAEAVDFGDDETERENLNALQSDPGSVWYMKGIHNVGQFQPADPKVFWEPIKALKESMASLTDTPFHYLERGLAGVSGGEALRVSEAPLLKKVADRQTSFGTTWREVFMFILKIEGISARIEVKWDTVESFDSLDMWDVMLKKINAGLSMAQALREAGYEENDIQRILAERMAEKQAGMEYERSPEVRVSTADNENFGNRNSLTEDAKDNGGRGAKAA